MKRHLTTWSILAVAGAPVSAMILEAAAPALDKGLKIDFTAPANGSRLSWGQEAAYAVTVTYDGKSTRYGEIPSNAVIVRTSFVPDADRVPPPAALPQAVLQISRSNCTGCHDFTANSAAPSFAAISKRDAGIPNAVAILSAQIRNGSVGNWGQGRMPPHPDLTPAQATAISQWIVQHANDPSAQYVAGKSGTFRMRAVGRPGTHSGMVLSAFYTGTIRSGESASGTAGQSHVIVYGAGS